MRVTGTYLSSEEVAIKPIAVAGDFIFEFLENIGVLYTFARSGKMFISNELDCCSKIRG